MTAAWKKYEASAARYLAERTGLKVVTTRKLGMGMQVGFDLALPDRSPVLGYHIECKHVSPGGRPRLPKWIEQAQDQAPNGKWVVWTNHQGKSSSVIENSPGHGYAYCVMSTLVHGAPDEIRRMSISAWVDLALLGRSSQDG